MTTREKICELILKTRKGKLAPEDLKPEADLRNDLRLDSLALAELLVLTEDSFGVEFSPEEAHSVATLGQMIDFIDKRLAAA
ncbi:acyl carrier protein [Pelobacter propionicus]|uniref:Phosphopantetheine-binding protein n=1 Tax=Pelobacter propionicus (strain DSM 2379 / NBRC 103807 / OttBd1) TaxID=338966 RepID=A1AP60_PELPD|nr:phosphopantetheine-binding protein [Pelobacter propionicus]ABK99130.1 phosphopantetheine-binding protein [Pelobacter propionicus DSM 2379]